MIVKHITLSEYESEAAVERYILRLSRDLQELDAPATSMRVERVGAELWRIEIEGVAELEVCVGEEP